MATLLFLTAMLTAIGLMVRECFREACRMRLAKMRCMVLRRKLRRIKQKLGV